MVSEARIDVSDRQDVGAPAHTAVAHPVTDAIWLLRLTPRRRQGVADPATDRIDRHRGEREDDR